MKGQIERAQHGRVVNRLMDSQCVVPCSSPSLFYPRFVLSGPFCLCLGKGELPVNYSLSQRDTFVSPCSLNVGVQGLMTEPR